MGHVRPNGAAKPCTRGTSNSNSRGNSEDRRRRRAFLVEKHGNKAGTKIQCFHCKRWLRVNTKKRTWEVDRFPICGHSGGRYTRDNVVPACLECNNSRCAKGCRVGVVGRRTIGESTMPSPEKIAASIPDGARVVEVVSAPEIKLDLRTPDGKPVDMTGMAVTLSVREKKPIARGEALNDKEQLVIRILATEKRVLTLDELAARAFPELKPEKANSWVRNSLRRPRERALARRVGKGKYELGQQLVPGAA